MKLDVLKAYETKRGRAVVVQDQNEYGDYLVWHAVLDQTIWHKSDGRVVGDAESSHHITGEWREPRKGEFWLNLYIGDDDFVCKHPSKAKADELASSGRLACVRVEWVEGQGLESDGVE